MPSDNFRKEALEYHSKGRPGKVQVVPTKPTQTKRDLSLAYSPGVAEPCLEIAHNQQDVYKYTAKGNLVAVITNGTAVLGLGNIGAHAAKPVMEGKGLLFKIYADIDVFDIELNTTNVDEFVRTVKILEPTFGGVNLEDIKAPECFEIETRLRKELNIPIMHDDQHGTAIVSGAGLINALEIVGKKIHKILLVMNGAGAAAISCAKIFIALGVKPENIIMFDSKGVLDESRDDLDELKKIFVTKRKVKSLEDAMKGADVFIGLSKANVINKKMIQSMARNPVVFAMANPDPEIEYHEAVESRPDVIVATGRSDYPNQVNNVLGFPYIFRGALDVRATSINEPMKLAAVKAIAALAHEPVPENVKSAYDDMSLEFGRSYIIPKPVDPRLLTGVSIAVAKAAIESGVAQRIITDWEAYTVELEGRLGKDNRFIRFITEKAKKNPKRVVFAEAENYDILKAAQLSRDEGIAIPILLGTKSRVLEIMDEHNLDLKDCLIIDPYNHDEENRELYAQQFYAQRQRKGTTLHEARKLMTMRNYYGCMMIKNGRADALISGMTRNYPSTIRPALQAIGKRDDTHIVAGLYIMLTRRGPIFLADTTINLDPDAEDIAAICKLTCDEVREYNITPRVALLSYSNFGSTNGETPKKMQDALKIIREQDPTLIVDGEMQAKFALNPNLLKEHYPFSTLAGEPANVLIFPKLSAGNIAYNLMQEIGEGEVIGPVLVGMKKSIHILQIGSKVRDILNMVTLAVVDAQRER
jgi:malate dehydrogenase (oxaloacetate-decarboxylating)(NADP+)